MRQPKIYKLDVSTTPTPTSTSPTPATTTLSPADCAILSSVLNAIANKTGGGPSSNTGVTPHLTIIGNKLDIAINQTNKAINAKQGKVQGWIDKRNNTLTNEVLPQLNLAKSEILNSQEIVQSYTLTLCKEVPPALSFCSNLNNTLTILNNTLDTVNSTIASVNSVKDGKGDANGKYGSKILDTKMSQINTKNTNLGTAWDNLKTISKNGQCP